MISPNRAVSSHSSSWRIFSLARLGLWPFQLSSKNLSPLEFQKTSIFLPIWFFSLISPAFSVYFRRSLWWMILFLIIKWMILGWEKKYGANEAIKKNHLGFSSKIEMLSSAWLGLSTFQLGLAQLGKFQLELPTCF